MKQGAITKGVALCAMEIANARARAFKRGYVPVGERDDWNLEIIGTPFRLRSTVRVYGKTWQRRVMWLTDESGNVYGLRAARRLLCDKEAASE